MAVQEKKNQQSTVKYNEEKVKDFFDLSQRILNYWKENQTFERSVSEREGNETFTFYEGPPSANGSPGIHHVMARAVKDIFCRYKTMQGYQVKRKGGWDTHGLPVELEVEKTLGIKKDDIGEKISIKDYNEKCREAVMKYKSAWEDLTEKMGYWIDLEDPYITFDVDYIESVWWLLKQFYEKDLLYKGYTIQPYSPAAGTGLSSHELNQPGCYKEVKDISVVAQFKAKGTENDYFLAWTTTPWTLPSNSALAVGENLDYVKVRTVNPYTHQTIQVYLAKDTLYRYFSEDGENKSPDNYQEGDKVIPFEIIEECKGKDLAGMEYEQLLPYVQPEDPAFKVIPGDFVTTDEGTGIVHIAPTFGADDLRVAQKQGIPAITVQDERGNPMPLVDKQGKFVSQMGEFAGRFVKQDYAEKGEEEGKKPVDVDIAVKLKEDNKAFLVEKYTHSYPHCWRTDKPVLYYPLDSWFIRTTAYKDKLVEMNKQINWKPESTGTGRFGNWLENLVDWNLSRSRFWGTPLPIWRSEDGEEKCIGSVEELRSEVDKSIEAGHMKEQLPEDFDLHRPYVDEVVLTGSNNQPMYRESDLIDVWFDSGAMPYAQWHYPFENQEVFNKNYPADFIAEGIDQTRGWFFTLHTIAVMLFDSLAYQNVVSNGLVLDKDGNKMSKRLGNVIDPFDTIQNYGPDAMRWYMITNAPPWDNLKFDLEGLREIQRRFFSTLENTYNFFVLYANIDRFAFQQEEVPLSERTESDRWIISYLNTLIKEVRSALDDYEPTRAARAIQNFVIENLSNWYVRLNRKRFWKGEYNRDKVAAYQTLYTCLETVAKLGAPIAPFYMEKLYLDLNNVSGKEPYDSVHLAHFPEADENAIDEELEERMDLAQRISSEVHALRKQHNIKVRQPLSKILIPILNEEQKQRLEKVENLVANEVNVKTIEYLQDTSGVLVKKIKPNFKKLGKLYGPKMKSIAAAVQQMSQEDINQLEQEGSFDLTIQEGDTISLGPDDVEISFEDIPGWTVASDEKVTVALDLRLTDELKQEGLARDLVNRIQNIRKDMGLDVQDKIRISAEKQGDLVERAIEANKNYICNETQALELNLEDSVNDGQEINLDDEHRVTIKVEA